MAFDPSWQSLFACLLNTVCCFPVSFQNKSIENQSWDIDFKLWLRFNIWLHHSPTPHKHPKVQSLETGAAKFSCFWRQGVTHGRKEQKTSLRPWTWYLPLKVSLDDLNNEGPGFLTIKNQRIWDLKKRCWYWMLESTKRSWKVELYNMQTQKSSTCMRQILCG